MKNSNDFEPIYLQDAKRHIQWLYDKIKSIDRSADMKMKKPSFFSKVANFLKRVF